MSVRQPPRAAPTLRELLARATWADLDRIAARYAVAFTGRRREVAVERLTAVLERPEQLRIALSVLPAPTRAVLGLLMLLGAADDLPAVLAARDRLVAARPDLAALLVRAHIANEVQALQSLGLCFVERRRLIVPHEVLRTLPCPLPVALPSSAPAAAPVAYAALAYGFERLLAAIAQSAPVAVQAHRTGGILDYQPQVVSAEAAAQLGAALGLRGPDAALRVSLLETLGAIAPVRGRWQVRPGWETLAQQAPAELLAQLASAWEAPRTLSDVARTGEFVWRCTADADYAAQIMRAEAGARVVVARWLRWIGAEPVAIDSLAATLLALFPQLFASSDDQAAWIVPVEAGRVPAADESGALARSLVRELLRQLAGLGLVLADATEVALAPLADPTGTPAAAPGPPIVSDSATTLRLLPLAVPAATIALVAEAGTMLPPDGEWARYELTAGGIQRLAQRGVGAADLADALLAQHAALDADFTAQLAGWAARAGRLRLHRPLAVLLTAPDAPLAQLLAAAGATDGAAVVGPGCAVLEPERVDPALEQLRARGFWPMDPAGRRRDG